MHWRLSLPLALILGLTQHLPLASAPPAEPPSGDWRLAKQRLLDNELVSVGREPKLSWTFEEKTFVLRFDDKAAPTKRATSLTETLTGATDAVPRIEGQWQVDDKKGLLLLSKIKAGGKDGRKEAQLKITGAGPVRLNLGDHQYNVIPRASDKKKEPPAAKKYTSQPKRDAP